MKVFLKTVLIIAITLFVSCSDKNVPLSYSKELNSTFNIEVELPSTLPRSVALLDKSYLKAIIFSDEHARMSFISGTRIDLCHSISVSDCTFKSVYKNKDTREISSIYKGIEKIHSVGFDLKEVNVNKEGITLRSKNTGFYTSVSLVELDSDTQLTYSLEIHNTKTKSINKSSESSLVNSKLASSLRSYLLDEIAVDELVDVLKNNNFQVRLSNLNDSMK